jgi:hypothetical protein
MIARRRVETPAQNGRVRVMVATAMVEGMEFVTADALIRRAKVVPTV